MSKRAPKTTKKSRKTNRSAARDSVPSDLIATVAKLNANRPDGFGELTAQLSNIGFPRVYENDVMIGTTTWVYNNRARSIDLTEAVEMFGVEGWTAYGVDYPGLCKRLFFAVADDMTESELNFHLSDKGVTDNLEELILGCIPYWSDELEEMRQNGTSGMSSAEHIMAAFGG